MAIARGKGVLASEWLTSIEKDVRFRCRQTELITGMGMPVSSEMEWFGASRKTGREYTINMRVDIGSDIEKYLTKKTGENFVNDFAAALPLDDFIAMAKMGLVYTVKIDIPERMQNLTVELPMRPLDLPFDGDSVFSREAISYYTSTAYAYIPTAKKKVKKSDLIPLKLKDTKIGKRRIRIV